MCMGAHECRWAWVFVSVCGVCALILVCATSTSTHINDTLFSTTRSGFRSECLFRVKPEIHVSAISLYSTRGLSPPFLFHFAIVCLDTSELTSTNFDVNEYGAHTQKERQTQRERNIVRTCVVQHGEKYTHLFTRIHTTDDDQPINQLQSASQPANKPTSKTNMCNKLYTAVESLSRKRNGKTSWAQREMTLVSVWSMSKGDLYIIQHVNTFRPSLFHTGFSIFFCIHPRLSIYLCWVCVLAMIYNMHVNTLHKSFKSFDVKQRQLLYGFSKAYEISLF